MQSGLLNTYKSNLRTRGGLAVLLGAVLFAFYADIYWFPHLDPLAKAIGLGGKWDIYGILYTLAIITGGIYFMRRHGNSRYQLMRTLSVIFFQVIFAFSIPYILPLFNMPDFNFAIFWPLKMDYFYPSYIMNQPLPFILYSYLSALILVPILTFWFGKRWYCSWVCGCGGLAETAGDSFRHLSNKSSGAWRFEKVSIYSVMFFAFFGTIIVLISWSVGDQYPTFNQIAAKFRGVYGFVIVALLSGILGVSLYPFMGSRVWCRFFCPLAGLMGIIQKFGRFRITVKPNMCISCGNCSTYCEMGIDVRSYAQTNQSFKRAACVGCGICAHVCPRGVLKLENK